MTRLEMLSVRLAEKLQGCDEACLRAYCLAATRWAKAQLKLEDPEVDEVLGLVESASPVPPHLGEKMLQQRNKALEQGFRAGKAGEESAEDHAEARSCFYDSIHSLTREISPSSVCNSIYDALMSVEGTDTDAGEVLLNQLLEMKVSNARPVRHWFSRLMGEIRDSFRKPNQ